MKRFVAVIAGFLLWSALWLCFNVALNRLGLLPAALTQPMIENKPLVALLVGSVLISLIAGYVTAALAGAPPSQALAILGVLLLLVGIYFQSRVWHLMPIWYHLTFLILLIPMVFAGARMHTPRAAL